MTNDENVLEFRTPDGADWRLVGWPRIRSWLEELATFWEWLPGSPAADPANLHGNLPQRYFNVITESERLRAAKEPPAALGAAIRQNFTDGYAPVHPTSDRGALIQAIRRVSDDEAVIFAASFLAGLVSMQNATTASQYRGATLAVSPEILAVADDAKLLQNERRRFRQTLRTLEEKEDTRQLEREAEWDESLRAAGRAARAWSHRRAKRWLKFAQYAREKEDAAISNIRAVEDAYKEQMGLKAPVKYWQDKADQHKTSEKWARVWVLLYFPISLGALGVSFYMTGIYLIERATAPLQNGAQAFPSAVFVVASAGLASCAGLVFWVGRLLTKLYLSQHHLRQDADERATMTETYLALIENSGASSDDRQIILNALFRNTPDGIVKEDGGLDPSIAAALGKFLAKP